MYYTMFKLSPVLMIALLLILALVVFRGFGSKSEYRLSPTSISINAKSTGSLSNLPSKLECVPGPTKDASYYTRGLTPGGICGAQKEVADQADYSITSGIGGSLLD
jgi:hypothetical protein